MGGVCKSSTKKTKQQPPIAPSQGLPPPGPIFQMPQQEPIEKPKQSHPNPSKYPIL